MAVAAEAEPRFVDKLRQLLGNDRVSVSQAIREAHGRGEAFYPSAPPAVVVFPETTEEVASVVEAAAAEGLPIIPFGTGTSLEGHVAALKGGVSIDTSRMDKVLRLSVDDLDVTVQPGVTRKALNHHLKDSGLFFPIDPGADASIGGMTATRASGTNAVRYGTMREAVLSLTVVLADGRVIRTARRARKSAAGYDLTRLFVGSEGTLGVITEITLRLHGMPEAISSAVSPFETLEGAVRTVVETIQMGVPVARIELLDEVQMRGCNGYSNLDYPERPTLFFEFHGTEAGVQEQAETVRDIAAENGGGDFQWATRPEDRTRLWEARHNAYYAAKSLKPGADAAATDVCVPISRLTECILETKKDLEESQLMGPIVGHAGDGNFHLTMLFDSKDPAELKRVKAFTHRLALRAIAMDGTCTGEHGVGYGKMPFLAAEHGEALDVMRSIKRALDPDNLMNPGKVIEL